MKIASALVLAVLAASSHAQVTCNTIGTFTTCSDGTSYNRIGSSVFGSDGSTAQRIGNSTFINTPQPNPYIPQPIRPIQPIQPIQPLNPYATQPRCFYNVFGQYVCQ